MSESVRNKNSRLFLEINKICLNIETNVIKLRNSLINNFQLYAVKKNMNQTYESICRHKNKNITMQFFIMIHSNSCF